MQKDNCNVAKGLEKHQIYYQKICFVGTNFLSDEKSKKETDFKL